MCYICVARGNVGPNYAATQKIIDGALRALGPTPASERGSHHPSWGDRHDWTKAPRGWKAAAMKKFYQGGSP